METDWKKPEIIILARGNTEEAVLFGCKMDVSATGPDHCHRDCQCTELGINCRVCKLRTDS